MLNILKQNNFKNLFNFIIIFKFLLLGFFSSELSSDLFFPFTNQFNQGNYNPWDFYEKNNLNPEAFPYHALMLYIHIIPSLLSSLIENVFLSNLLFKMPLLISDFIIYKLLCLLYENKKRIIIKVFNSDHRVPTISYGFIEKRKKLKNDYLNLDKNEIIDLKKNGIEITEEVEFKHFVFCGDTTHKIFDNKEILDFKSIVIECTFFEEDDLPNVSVIKKP